MALTRALPSPSRDSGRPKSAASSAPAPKSESFYTLGVFLRIRTLLFGVQLPLIVGNAQIELLAANLVSALL